MNDAPRTARFPRSSTWHAVSADSPSGKARTLCGLEVEIGALRFASVPSEVGCARCKAKLGARIFSACGSADAWHARGKRNPVTLTVFHAAFGAYAAAHLAGTDERNALLALHQAAQVAGVELGAEITAACSDAYESLEAERAEAA